MAAPVTLAQPPRTRTGWTIGGGVEWRFAPRGQRLEGNYYDYGNNNRSGQLQLPDWVLLASPAPSTPNRPRPLSGRRELETLVPIAPLAIKPRGLGGFSV
jgi:hypothetical protein